MTTEHSTAEFEARLAKFVEGCSVIHTKYITEGFPTLAETTKYEFLVMRGKKFVRIVHQETHIASGNVNHRSVHCFVDATNGDVLKSESWKKPAKHARGNIFADDNGLKCMGPHGAAYLR